MEIIERNTVEWNAEYGREGKFKRYSNNVEGSRQGNELRSILVCIRIAQTLRRN